MFHIADWGARLPLPFLVLSILVLLLFSWWSYSGMPSLPVRWRWTLATLRFLSLSLLCLLLAGMWIDLVRLDGDRSAIPIYLDSSESLRQNRSGWAGIDATEEAVSTLRQELERSNIPYEMHHFAGSVDPSTRDSLWRSATRIGSVVEHVREQTDPPPAVLLLSDGLDTDSELNDISPLSSIPPLFTISMGASVSEQDLVLEEVLLPNPLDLNQRNRLWVRISRSRMDVSSATVELQIDGEVTERQSIPFSSGDSVAVQSIPVVLQDSGRVMVDVRIVSRQEEWSAENNHWREERTVHDRRMNVWHIATSIHPDIRWVREQLRSDRQLRSHNLNLFDEPVGRPDTDPELIIVHGNPHSGAWPASLARFPDGSGVLWMAGPSGIAIPDGQNRPNPPARPPMSEGGPSLRALSTIETESRTHPLIEPFQAWLSEATTPLWIHAADWQTEAATQTIRMEGSPSLPFLFLQEVGDRRRSLISTTGWYRLSHSGSDEEIELARELFSSILQWTATSRVDTDSVETEEALSGAEWTKRMRELHPSRRDDRFLRGLSNQTGGVWRTIEPSERSEEWFHSLEQQVDRDRERRSRLSVHSSPVWYILLVLLLASEWVLRRRLRMM